MKKLLYPLVICITFITNAQNFWQQANFPSFYDGEILSIASKNDLVIASSYQNGLAISTNSGDKWFHTNPTISFQPNSAVSISNAGYLFAVGVDGYVYRSTDTGNTWFPCSNIKFHNGPEILTDYNTGFIYISSHLGIYRSTDEGESWSQKNSGLVVGGGSPFTRIALSGNGILVASTPSGIFKSTDNADTWIRVSFMSATVLAVNSLGYIFADKYSEDPYFYSDTLYRSTDNGVSWLKLNQQAGLIFIDPVDDAIVTTRYDYTHNYSLSTDNGISWNTIFSEKSPRCMSYNGNNNYFMGTSGAGIFKSNSLNGLWQLCVDGFPGAHTFVSSILCQPGIIYAGTKGFGLYQSTDNGAIFNKITPGIPSSFSADKLFATSNGYLFTYANNGTIIRSTDNGISWSYYSSPGVLYDLVTNSLCTTGSIILTGGKRNLVDCELDRSTDNGETWNEVFSISGNYDEVKYNIIALAINNNGTAIGCLEKGVNTNPLLPHWIYSYSIIRSTDFGATWDIQEMNYDKIIDFAWNYSNKIFAITSQGLLKSDDDGLTWNYTTGNLPTLDLKCIVISNNNNIYVGTGNYGIIISTDDGGSWNSINQGLADTTVNTMAISSNGFLFSGTENSGIFRSISPITSVENLNEILLNQYYLFQNYPNPFNPSTIIKYSIPKTSYVTIKVYDLLGKEIATLVNEEKLMGNYEIEFDGSNLSSGVYFYKMQAGNFSETKKLILLK